MKPNRLLVLVGVLLLFLPRTKAAGDGDDDAFSPERAQLIYKALISPENSPAREKSVASGAAVGKTDRQIERVAEMMHQQNIRLQGRPGLWEFEYQGRQIFLLVDASAGLASMITPVAGLDQLRAKPDFDESRLFEKLLKANYLLTQEVRFALNRKVIWLTYVHPVDSLVERDITRALDHLVTVAAQTSGSPRSEGD